METIKTGEEKSEGGEESQSLQYIYISSSCVSLRPHGFFSSIFVISNNVLTGIFLFLIVPISVNVKLDDVIITEAI